MNPENQLQTETKTESQLQSLSYAARAGLFLIRGYQKWISPILGANCRFRPTCSRYTYEAIEKYGIIKGTWKGFLRILRCNPFSPGGDDPLE